MKFRLLFLASWLILYPSFAALPLEIFCSHYQEPIYQDIIIDSEIYPIGTDCCEERYQLIKQVLDRFDAPFSLLDLGAAQGYFSFRTAYDYPKSSVVMIESNNTSYYAHHGDMLYELCLLNPRLSNIFFLNKRLDIRDVHFLNAHEHFDIILALLVVHLMDESLQKQISIIESLMQLADNLIIEVANDVGVVHTSYVEYMATALGGHYLGEVKRHKNSSSTSTGKLFWFKSKSAKPVDDKQSAPSPIKKTTFTHLNGVYPPHI